MAKETVKFHHPTKLSGASPKLDFNIFSEELSSAQYALGLLQGSHRELKSAQLLMSPLSAKEATVSSSIEGTQSTVSDIFRSEAGGSVAHSDVFEVINYRRAIQYAFSQHKLGRPINEHLVKTLHSLLLNNARHEGPAGAFRSKPVWIAEKRGDPIEKALYVPPEHMLVPEYMDDLLAYIATDGADALITSGIAHYQFEAIHPFTDGNGRIGRLLIPLVLCNKQKISQPILYISGYFQEHSDTYREALRSVDRTGRYEEWLKFYLQSIAAQLRETQKLIDDIYELHRKVKKDFGKTKSPYLAPFIDFLFEKPIFTVPMAQASLAAAQRSTVVSLINLFKKAELVHETPAKHGRAKLYEFGPLLNLLY